MENYIPSDNYSFHWATIGRKGAQAAAYKCSTKSARCRRWDGTITIVTISSSSAPTFINSLIYESKAGFRLSTGPADATDSLVSTRDRWNRFFSFFLQIFTAESTASGWVWLPSGRDLSSSSNKHHTESVVSHADLLQLNSAPDVHQQQI